jgi:beta-lactamase class D
MKKNIRLYAQIGRGKYLAERNYPLIENQYKKNKKGTIVIVANKNDEQTNLQHYTHTITCLAPSSTFKNTFVLISNCKKNIFVPFLWIRK